MGYVLGEPDDEREHAEYHDQVVNGVVAPSYEGIDILWREGEDRIGLITGRSPRAHQEMIDSVLSIANLETRYDGGIPAGESVRIPYYRDDRILGLILLERRDKIWRGRWQSDAIPVFEQLANHEPMWSVVFVWVHEKVRKQGIARRLWTQATKYLGIEADKLGWYTPFTAEGERFARSLYPDGFYVAK
jgi:GNAT superfamily N-acetyltransferase